MDRQSYEDGRIGRASGPGTDMGAYRQGQLHTEAGRYKPGWEGGESNASVSEPVVPVPKVEVDGAAFTLLLMSPLLFTVYPVWGLSLYAAVGATLGIFSLTPYTAGGTPAAVGIAFATLAAGFAAFFYGIRLEGMASQWALYRMVRMAARWVTPFLFVIWMGTRNGSLETIGQLVNRASPGTFFGGILATILAHFVFRKADQIYFPVAKEVERMQELAARGEPLKRGFGKRVIYSVLWIVPAVAICNLIVRIAIGLIMEDAARVAFYGRYGDFVTVASFVVWLVLSIAGILPGTGSVAISAEKLQSTVG